MSYIEFKNIVKEYKMGEVKIKALDNTNFSIDKGELVVIVGPSGAGKTSALNILGGMDKASSGRVWVNNKEITKLNDKELIEYRRNDIGFVFQFPEYQLFEETVLKDIMFAPKNFGESEEKAKAQALEVSNLLGIPKELLKKSPFNLSGGQMRKVAIAGILSYNPDVLILDEPTRGLDPEGAREIM